ncbi:hypothetical protein LJC68_01700 [Bacteroidales bacterium OttesenSCG-928-B11]|nr:hypothetical protein [Bacteroidales bacterium OttesenSCG-928-C03]MDL2311578.1 hypothetical protein [Bacteroidales bacterium OttesenSCG-928-B11]
MGKSIVIVFTTVFLIGQVFAQELEIQERDFFIHMKDYDLSVVLTADSIVVDENGKIPQSEILGFIGDDFQRFEIHFISVIQNQSNPYEYFAYGKTKVENNICEFQGTITIKNAKLYDNPDWVCCNEDTLMKFGYTKCDVVLYEDKKTKFPGFIKGSLTSNFLIDLNGMFRYDSYMFVADGFNNNQFVGTWASYKTKSVKKCNWGDYRIPESGDLDSGAGEFCVDEKYVKNGWENYKLAWQTYPKTQEVIKARQKEQEQWWK